MFAKPPSLFTWGYGKRHLLELKALIRANNIGNIVDVRLLPESTHNQVFNRNALNNIFKDRYIWKPELGNLDYNKLGKRLKEEDKGLEELANIVFENVELGFLGPLLLCAEESHEICHRSMVAEKLKAKIPMNIIHLGSEANLFHNGKGRGELNLNIVGYFPPDRSIVAIIGPRRAGNGITEEQHREDLNIAYRIAVMCAKKGYVVLSGLAIGMDTAGHRGAIDAGGYTIAVLAHGLEAAIYPNENQHLVWDILQGRGAIVSQYEPDALPTKELFIERDKTQALLSDRVIVVGSFPGNVIKGGSRHCARWAREFNVPVHLLTNINGYKYIDYFEIA